MADDDLAWDDDGYEVPELQTTVVKKFDEDAEEGGKKPKAGGKNSKDKGSSSTKEEVDDEVLSDPLAEKLRQQRLQEEADLKAAKEAFGGPAKNIDEMVPKTDSEFAEYADLVAAKYVCPFQRDPKYALLIKSLVRSACAQLTAADIKARSPEIESGIVAVRNQKVKEEKEVAEKRKKAAAAASSAKNKKQITVDNDLDDAIYATGGRNVDDDYDFM